ncbi:hypothetical protein GL213_09140 [Halogeometricum borinquense]|uniref:Uncharacterized protein n=1 Tax=Halogeometricum borinquense (strain ATCC 700274 / DSM 11551 / JCM 10706 / KCTC 4070 / PR3) TaxID=469382 RepID=E4NMZ3_HALBP|nr:hypothetical protein [Halogeometricum borinquense]ADQ67405.1 hypothetical protein Hbor_18380 [Halogeometricum borinquense DSM 11551]ELY28617.1 hypothetical protein C499_08140 [Halogeometricum borinquense DSM 11551]QIQ76672.1 hypothetical protein GL213_09140 [Halogeometricum borinquense]
MSTLDAEIDALARRIERQIRRNEARLAELPDFDPEWRQTASSLVPDSDELFL